jgi:hypothetical protein
MFFWLVDEEVEQEILSKHEILDEVEMVVKSQQEPLASLQINKSRLL